MIDISSPLPICLVPCFIPQSTEADTEVGKGRNFINVNLWNKIRSQSDKKKKKAVQIR